ncbi:MAG: helix-turn-helix domain-containing protein [Bacillota bacterium]|nr:helix-turn-helix domain-containing protein [Bacillota bacterium]
MDKDYIKLFEPLPKDEFLEIRENYNKSVWISSIEELKKYEINPDKEIFIQQHTKGNKKDRTGNNSKSIKHLFFDIDNTQNFNLLLLNIKGAGMPKPTIIINSGGGFHVYYKLKERTYKNISPILKNLALKIGADTRATDRARILRLESSCNNKSKYNKPLVEVVYKNNINYDLSIFEKIADITAEKPTKSNTVTSTEVESKDTRKSKYTKDIVTDMYCVNEMLKGVGQGQRNFALGRITKKLQQLGYQKHKAKIIILSWNNDNKPPENKEKLINDFNIYWAKDYKLLGCQFDNPSLQLSLNDFCNKSKCKFRKRILNFEVKNQELLNYSNELLKDNKYYKISGNALVLYGLLKYHDKGLNRDELKEKTKSNITGKQTISNRLLSKNLKELEKFKLIKIHKRYKNISGRNKDLIKALESSKFNLGYTLISHLIIRMFLNGAMTQAEFKVYLLLRSYIYKGKAKVWPNQERMAYTLKISQQAVSKHINNLEKKGFIKIEYTYTSKGHKKCIYRV